MNIITSYEEKRGCGYRKQGGLYLVSGSLSDSCQKLPIPLIVCPTCHAGVKPSRGWTWVGFQLIKDAPCTKLIEDFHKDAYPCTGCPPFDGSVERFGLLWIGEKFYKTPYEFNKEAITQGISRRINYIPKDFVLGETWVLMAHRKCIPDGEDFIPGIFCVFRPTTIEYIVKDDDTDEHLESLEKRGISLVRIKKRQLKIEDNV